MSKKNSTPQENHIQSSSYTPKADLNKQYLDFTSNDRFRESVKNSESKKFMNSIDEFDLCESIVENPAVEELCSRNDWFIDPANPDQLKSPIELKKFLVKQLGYDFSPLTQYDPFTYDGETKDGYRHGYGQLKYKNVEIYNGLFLQDAVHTPAGKTSMIKDIEGAQFFEGKTFFGRKQGAGCIFHRNGKPYCKANFIDDIIVDKKAKIYSEETGNLIFTGEMVDGLKNGIGIEYFDFSENQMAILKGQSKNKQLLNTQFIDYKGEFKEDLRSGRGTEYKVDHSGNSYVVCNSLWSFGNKILDNCQYDNSGKLARRVTNNNYLFCVDYSKKTTIKYISYKDQS